MTTTRKQYSPRFKARVAMEAIRGEKTLSQLGSQFKVHPMEIAKWRKVAIDQLPELFVDGRTRKRSVGLLGQAQRFNTWGFFNATGEFSIGAFGEF